MSFVEDDAAALLSDFGVTVTKETGQSFTAILNRRYARQLVDLGGGGIMSGMQCSLTARSADVEDLQVNNTLTVDGTLYYVLELSPDGRAFTVVSLSKDSAIR